MKHEDIRKILDANEPYLTAFNFMECVQGIKYSTDDEGTAVWLERMKRILNHAEPLKTMNGNHLRRLSQLPNIYVGEYGEEEDNE